MKTFAWRRSRLLRVVPSSRDINVHEFGLRNLVINAIFEVRICSRINTDLHKLTAVCLLQQSSADPLALTK